MLNELILKSLLTDNGFLQEASNPFTVDLDNLQIIVGFLPVVSNCSSGEFENIFLKCLYCRVLRLNAIVQIQK